MMHVVATAGHVDHGKSALVYALTGMDPDRWPEERRRELTIDLGYGWTELADGSELALVDVPGHERFIANTLAGLGPVPAVLFVVAADAGWSAQSEEHLNAIDALHVEHGVLAVTRSDLADPRDAMTQSIERIGQSSLGSVRAVAVSATTGLGLPQLRAALSAMVATLPPPDPDGRVRLWIDRAFSIRGTGTVVTGTLGAGTIAPGDRLLLGRRPVVVRSVQALGRDRDRVSAVARVAVSLRGVDRTDVTRGDVLLADAPWHRTRVFDVRLRPVDPTVRWPSRLTMHIGTLAIPIHIRPLGADTARLTLQRELPLLAGDRAVLRDTSRHTVIAGVDVLDADPPPLRRRGAARDRGDELADGRPDAYHEITRRGAVREDHLAALGIDIPDRDDLHHHGGWVIAEGQWQDWLAAAPDAVVQWAAQHPLDPAMPLGVLAQRLALPDEALLAPVLAAAGLAEGGGRVAASLAVTLGPAERSVRSVESWLFEHPFHAPDRDELRALDLGRRELAAAEKAHRLVCISDDIVLLPDSIEQAAARLRELPAPFTSSQARQALDSTRRVVIPLLEYLDGAGYTVRLDGSRRTMAQSPPSPAPDGANERTEPNAD
jgi:selenocysteine-specific elongation factor